MSSVEKLLRQGHVNQDDLLTERADNLLNENINPEHTTIGDTKGKKEEKKTPNTIRVRRTMVITDHGAVLHVFFPIIAFGASLLLFIQVLIAIAAVYYGS
ncbi:DUF4342 domain-containing protein [Caenorhabditis elegans]|uniref:DUF4342 domain-containing protein n=1 Tax=Caenorhabditis elegans TaxID=6239 RepID=B1Q261_CAEEL|nr:DUF4342 domain-containing protein [Caenorhabditis elegans]CAQ16140.1 DUF4342 domain-containing protein [Caenorhabditis elegans]|eukprot:NP_001122949.1 Uncharacterized protein CELE_F53F4.18 [Caenorhabditis elegans]